VSIILRTDFLSGGIVTETSYKYAQAQFARLVSQVEGRMGHSGLLSFRAGAAISLAQRAQTVCGAFSDMDLEACVGKSGMAIDVKLGELIHCIASSAQRPGPGEGKFGR